MPISHDWLRSVRVTYVPGDSSPFLDEAAAALLEQFKALGHRVQESPDNSTDLLVTTAHFGSALGWRQSLLLAGRRRFSLESSPTVYTLVQATPAQLQEKLDYFASVLAKEPPDPEDFEFPGLPANAYHTLVEQGRRGGPIMALIRLLQAQLKCIRIVLVIGEERPESAFYFDLVGAHPRIAAADREAFYKDMVLRLVTAVSTHEVTAHEVAQPPMPLETWRRLQTPGQMVQAARSLGKRRFFTEMVRVANLATVPNLDNAISSQYSEGCFATWDAEAQGLVATITGSARPVEKDNISEDDLALIIGVRPGGLGAIVRHVDGKRNDSPSSESVEMKEMDDRLPRINLGAEWGGWAGRPAPVSRSKLHGHRGVSAFDPALVEWVQLDEPYYHYPVSCATGAQAQAIMAAFGRSEALRNPDDPRKVVFTVLPGHGVVIVEKWVAGKAPFELICDYMDAGRLEVANAIPQGPMHYEPDPASGRLTLRTETAAEAVGA